MESAIQFMCQDLGNQERSAWVVIAIHHTVVPLVCYVSGVGGMDVATAMTGVPMRLKMPRIVNVRLTGELKPGCNTKEVILEMLRRVSIKGGLGNVYEYTGPAVKDL